MSAMDPDCGVNAIVNYTLSDSSAKPQFAVKADSGELCIAAPLDHEATSDFEFPVIATDRGKKNLNIHLVFEHVCGLGDSFVSIYERRQKNNTRARNVWYITVQKEAG